MDEDDDIELVADGNAPQQSAIRSDGDDSGTPDADRTFSTISTPPEEELRAQLDRPPPMTQPAGLKKGTWANLRKPRGHVDIEHTFKHIFGKSVFKGRQQEIMEAAVRGCDILAIAPTGMGKSLCFQVPAVAEEHGVTLVVTPLLALMENQVENLRKLRIPCAMYTSRTDPEEVKEIKKDLRSGHPKVRLLYVTPERLAMPKFRDLLAIVEKQGELARLVIDEAHCISEWGHDFRKEYQQIGEFRQLFGKVPIMALTASATKEVRQDIILSLDMRLDNLLHVVHSFNRVNLFYEVRYIEDDFQKKLENAVNYISSMHRRKMKKNPDISDEEARVIQGIIYCRKRETCDKVAGAFRAKGIMASAFHRGLTPKACDATCAQWLNAEDLQRQGKRYVDVIVATVAFGMGIDAPKVRYVIHFDMPMSFEGYYQETGRAGRDGHGSRCLLYYSRRDGETIRYMAGKQQASREKKANGGTVAANPKKSVDDLIKYAENTTQCRHILICRYFGEKPEAGSKLYCNRFCDVCKDPQHVAAATEVLTSETLLATQRPQILHEAEDEWNDADEEETSRDILSRSVSVAESDLFAPSIQGLPGFAKASDLAKKRPFEIMQDEFGLESELFPEQSIEITQPSTSRVFRFAEEPVQMAVDEVPTTEERTWVPKKRLNTDLSRHNLANVSNASLDKERSLSAMLPPALTQTPPPKAGRLNLFNEPSPEVHEARMQAVREAGPKSPPPPRAPIPKQIPGPRPPVSGPSKFTSVIGLKTNFADMQASASTTVAPSSNGGKTSVIGVKTNLSGATLAVSTTSASWKAPFKKDHVRARVTSLEPIEVMDDSEDIEFKLIPMKWEKPIGANLRRSAIRQLHTVLTRAFLSSGGRRATSEEDDIFQKLGIPESSSRTRATLMLFAALEAESEIFWLSMTSAGYAAYVSQRVGLIKSLSISSSWLDSFPSSPNAEQEAIFKIMIKTVKWRRVHQTLQETSTSKDRLYGSDSDEE